MCKKYNEVKLMFHNLIIFQAPGFVVVASLLQYLSMISKNYVHCSYHLLENVWPWWCVIW